MDTAFQYHRTNPARPEETKAEILYSCPRCRAEALTIPTFDTIEPWDIRHAPPPGAEVEDKTTILMR